MRLLFARASEAMRITYLPGGGLVPTAMPLAVQYDDLPPLAAAERVTPQSGRSKGSMHWGHIAFYYLTEQMHRWERFVFRFDKQFHSISALKSIVGEDYIETVSRESYS